jgi:cytochrome c556
METAYNSALVKTMKLHQLIAVIILGFAFACSSSQPSTPAAAPQPEFRTTTTIKDIMDSIVDPSADEIWESVATVVDAKGIHEKYPQTDEEWKAVRRDAVRLLEATNLLQIPGRQVAKHGEKSENPGIELEPEEMEKLINNDKATFYARAKGLHDAVMVAFNAIEAKDKDALLSSGAGIDEACEKCHMTYWYPNEAKNLAEQQQKQ